MTNTDQQKFHTIIALDDRDTWCAVNGASIVVIDDEQFDRLCNGEIDLSDLKPISELPLKAITNQHIEHD
jgi:hypothetical protein